jgi:hypothetical protein
LVNTDTFPYRSGSPVALPSVSIGGITSSGVMPLAVPGSAPLPCLLDTTPYGTRGSADRVSTSSTSPGSAPVTYTGPVTTCGPSTSKFLVVRS